MGRACYQAGDTECATATTSRVLELEPENPDALYNLGAIHANSGRKDLARRYWERAVRAAPASESGRMAAAALGKL
ncbi:MAG: tetratricopeptide repeat protein [Bryobacteraceae bacterium]